MAELAPDSDVPLLSSWCTPAETPRNSIQRDDQRNASCETQAGSPSTITRSVCAKLNELEESGEILGSGIKANAFSEREWSFVQNNMQLLELSKEENSGYIYPASFKKKRAALRVLMGELRGTDVSSGIAKNYLREKHVKLWSYIEYLIQELLQAEYLKLFWGWEYVGRFP